MKYIANRYEIIEDEIVFGKQYKARDLEKEILVYIQLIKDNKYVSENFLPDLIDESTVLSQINSNEIAKILDLGIEIGDEERYYYVVSEFFEGIELKKVIKDNYMDLNSIAKITKKILRVLDDGYRNNLYHGSLTEENIFVDDNYNIKIYDYCITKANKGVNIRKDNCIGFLSPHQLNINYTDMESDLFTLGIILFDAIFKKMPFGIGEDEEKMLKLIDRGIDWNTVKINNENIELVNIVKKLIRRREKYNNINEVLIDLSKFMYVKAEIKENQDIQLNEEKIEVKNSSINKNMFFKKIAFLILTIMILVTVISQFS